MKLHVDLETLQLIEGPGFRNPVTSLRFKRGDAARLEVSFLEGGTTAVAIGDPNALEIRFGIKPRNRYDVGYLVHDAVWTMPAVDAENPVYQCSPSFNTGELNSALGVGSSTGTELAEITLMGEITWREGDGEPTSTRTFLVVVENDVNRGTEGVPQSAEPTYPAPDSLVTQQNLGERAVRHDIVQSLTVDQKARVLANIGALSVSELSFLEGHRWLVLRTGNSPYTNYHVLVGRLESTGRVAYRSASGGYGVFEVEYSSALNRWVVIHKPTTTVVMRAVTTGYDGGPIRTYEAVGTMGLVYDDNFQLTSGGDGAACELPAAPLICENTDGFIGQFPTPEGLLYGPGNPYDPLKQYINLIGENTTSGSFHGVMTYMGTEEVDPGSGPFESAVYMDYGNIAYLENAHTIRAQDENYFYLFQNIDNVVGSNWFHSIDIAGVKFPDLSGYYVGPYGYFFAEYAIDVTCPPGVLVKSPGGIYLSETPHGIRPDRFKLISTLNFNG